MLTLKKLIFFFNSATTTMRIGCKIVGVQGHFSCGSESTCIWDGFKKFGAALNISQHTSIPTKHSEAWVLAPPHWFPRPPALGRWPRFPCSYAMSCSCAESPSSDESGSSELGSEARLATEQFGSFSRVVRQET